MTEIKRGHIRRGVELLQSYTQHLGEGLVATNGVVYSAVATIGTAVVEVLNALIDPGFDLSLKELEVSFTQKFTELTGGTTSGSLAYYWEARQESVATIREWINLSGTYAKGIAAGANVEDTFEGYVPVGSIPQAPVRIRLMAESLYADAYEGKVKNDSYIRLVGLVIPGA